MLTNFKQSHITASIFFSEGYGLVVTSTLSGTFLHSVLWSRRTQKAEAANKHLRNKGNEMDGTCGTYGGQESSMECSYEETPKERGHLEDLDIDRSIILKWILKK
jgi:hypothetical protein